MSYALDWLETVLRDAGLRVAVENGWQTAGRGEMGKVRGVMCHHTANSNTGYNFPSHDLLIKGRPQSDGSFLHGPLANLALGRDGTFYVLAAGRANHAGKGNWQGEAKDQDMGNWQFIGIEAENNGVGETWPEVQMTAYAHGVAALLKKIGADPIMCCGHKEYAPHRKNDPTFDMNIFRADVTRIMASGAKPPLVPAVDEHQRPTLKRGAGGDTVKDLQKLVGAMADGDFGGATEAAVRAFQRAHDLTPDGIVGPKTWQALEPR